MALKRYQERVLREVTIFLEALASQQAAGNVRQTFRFQVLDEGEYEDRDWQDDLKKFLEDSAAYGSQ